jgi:hypothetical protein
MWHKSSAEAASGLIQGVEQAHLARLAPVEWASREAAERILGLMGEGRFYRERCDAKPSFIKKAPDGARRER